MKPLHLDNSSAEGSQMNLEALYNIAPSCFTEVRDERTGELRHKVDFDALRALLGDSVASEGDEMYQFTWPGKREARREAARQIDKTLRPVKEDSVDWDTTENLYIEGDNLDALKLLQRSYLGKVKMIYIDPPYNTGNDFVYNDSFSVSKQEHDLAEGNVDELGIRYRRNTDSNGRFHSDWCSMIYSRLLVARTLLTDDGVIFISIDEAECANIKKIGDEIFGENNFLSIISRRTKAGGGSASKHFAIENDFIYVYAKNAILLPNMYAPFDEKYLKRYAFEDEKGRYFWDTMARACTATVPYLIEAPDGTMLKGHWFRSEERFLEDKKNGEVRIIKKDNGDWSVQFKQRMAEGKKVRTLFAENEFKSSQDDLETLALEGIFSFPKPVYLLKYIIQAASNKDSIILDFFSGSATTAHAVMQLNAEDGGKRKFIMVQLPEETTEASEAYKAGYKNICEIGKERIRRAGKKIKADSPLTTQNLDTGFRVLRIDESNYLDVKRTPADYSQASLDLFADNLRPDRTDMDLLFGCLTAWGLSLSLPMESEEVDGCTVYTVNGGDLVACFSENVTEEVVRFIAQKHPLRIVFRDKCFSEDKQKINLFEQFKQLLDWSEEDALANIRVI